MASQDSTTWPSEQTADNVIHVDTHDNHTVMTAGVSEDPKRRNGLVYRHALSAIVWALVFNLLIAAAKLFVATVVTRSAALFSEGLHSLGDCMNSITLLLGIKMGNRAPDPRHPFGYGLETNLWALLASLLLFASAIYAIYSGWERLLNPEPLHDVFWAILILVVSLVLEFFAVWTASRAVVEEVGIETRGLGSIPKAYQHIREVVGPTTRFVFYEDTIAFLGALVALVGITAGQWAVAQGWLPLELAHLPDAIASVVIGGLLMFLAVNLFRYNKGFLIGAAASRKVERQIREIVLSIHGVSKIHHLSTLDQGLSGLIVHLSVDVEADTPVKDVDDLTEHIKSRLQDHIPSVRQVYIEVLADDLEETWERKFIQVVQQGETISVLKPRDRVMLENVYYFTQSVVRDVMVPRTDVDAIEISTPIGEAIEYIFKTSHSRYPVFRENPDNLEGFIHVRDLFHLAHKQGLGGSFKKIVLDIDIYPENKPVSDLLEEFKKNKIQLAAVADEHGGFAGLVTIEDLMEEIVGEIWDEHDVEEFLLEHLAPNKILVHGKYPIEELNERFELNIPDDEFHTIGGFVFGTLGREPELNDQVTFEDLTLTVTDADGPRIKQVTIESTVDFDTPPESTEG